MIRSRTVFASFLFVAFVGAGSATAAEPTRVRFHDLDASTLEAILSGKSRVIVEFRAGDVLPLAFEAEGDLIHNGGDQRTPITVERTFFLRSSDGDLEISTDGAAFRPLRGAVSGRLAASAEGDDGGRVSALKLKLEANLRP